MVLVPQVRGKLFLAATTIHYLWSMGRGAAARSAHAQMIRLCSVNDKRFLKEDSQTMKLTPAEGEILLLGSAIAKGRYS